MIRKNKTTFLWIVLCAFLSISCQMQTLSESGQTSGLGDVSGDGSGGNRGPSVSGGTGNGTSTEGGQDIIYYFRTTTNANSSKHFNSTAMIENRMTSRDRSYEQVFTEEYLNNPNDLNSPEDVPGSSLVYITGGLLNCIRLDGTSLNPNNYFRVFEFPGKSIDGPLDYSEPDVGLMVEGNGTIFWEPENQFKEIHYRGFSYNSLATISEDESEISINSDTIRLTILSEPNNTGDPVYQYKGRVKLLNSPNNHPEDEFDIKCNKGQPTLMNIAIPAPKNKIIPVPGEEPEEEL